MDLQAELVGIAHPLAVDGLGAVFGDVEARAEVDGPRHLEHLITVLVHGGFFRPFLLGAGIA